ncbi:MAG: beta-propeller domain-containing protein, partial [Pseudomonadota bacterium]
MSAKKNLWIACLFMPILIMSAGCDVDNTTPSPDRIRTTAKLKSFSACSDLEETLKANVKEELRIQLLTTRNIRVYYGPEDGTTDNSAPKGGSGREEGVDYSGTNNQETGVDEADFVKTDGYYIYVLNGNQLVTAGVPEFGLLEKGTAVTIEGYPTQMLLSKDSAGGRAKKAVIFSTVYTWNLSEDHPLHALLLDNGTIYNSVYAPYYRCSDLTKLTVLDLADAADPKVTRELYIEGYYQTARKVENSVHMVSYSWMELQGLKYWPD